MEIKDIPFEDFLASPYMKEKRVLPAQPQSNGVRDSSVQVYFFKLESIDEALMDLSKRFYGSQGLKPIPHTNASSGKHDWKNMSERAEEMVRDLYSEDFERFDYPSD